MDKKLIELFNKAISDPTETQILASVIASTLQSADLKPIKAFLATFKRTVKNTHVAPSCKLRALHVFCECMKQASPSFLQAAERKLAKRLMLLAMHRKESPGIARGATLFSNSSQIIEEAEASVAFFNLLLVSLQEWADKYVHSRSGELSKFNRLFQRLLTEGVVFPASFDISTQRQRLNRYLSLISEGNPADIIEIRKKLLDIRLQLTQALEKEQNSALTAEIRELLGLIDRGLEPKKGKVEVEEREMLGNSEAFERITEPQPMEMEWEGEVQVYAGEEEGRMRSSVEQLSEDLKLVSLRLECETLKEQRRQLESENLELHRVIASLTKEVRRASIPFSSPAFISNKSNFRVLLPQRQGTLYSDKYCTVLVDVRVESGKQTCEGRFMIVVNSKVEEVQRTVELQGVEVKGLICRTVKDINKADFDAKGRVDAQYRFRYTDIQSTSPIYTFSFISEGLQYLYHFQLPLVMLHFAQPVGMQPAEFQEVWEEGKSGRSEVVVGKLDALIQNLPQLGERMMLGSCLAVFIGSPIEPRTVAAGGTFLGELVLIKATVSSARTATLQTQCRTPKIRVCVSEIMQQMLEDEDSF